MDLSVSGKDEIWFLRVCHHVPHELYVFVLRKGSTPKRERFNTIARPDLKIYAAPRRIPPSPHRREDFSLFKIFSPCLQIALALGTEGPGDWYRDLLINNPPPHSFYSIYRLLFNIVETWRLSVKAETCSFNCRIYHLFWTSCVSD